MIAIGGRAGPDGSSGDAVKLNLYRQAGVRADAREQTPEVRHAQGHASRRWRALRPRDMHEDGAAAAGHSRAGIVVDLDDEVVEMIVPPQPVAWFSGRAAEGAVVAPVARILTPGNLAE